MHSPKSPSFSPCPQTVQLVLEGHLTTLYHVSHGTILIIPNRLIPNAPVVLPRDSYDSQPKPCLVVQGTGQKSDPDTAFNLRQRIYPDPYTSMAD